MDSILALLADGGVVTQPMPTEALVILAIIGLIMLPMAIAALRSPAKANNG